MLAFGSVGTVVATPPGTGSWLSSPGSADWNTGTNWSPNGVPTVTANFGTSTTTTITLSASASVGTLQFNSGAPVYTFSIGSLSSLTINGTGIVNNSSNAPIFTGGGALVKVGSGTLTLAGSNSYSGGTSFNGGIVAVTSDANLGTGPLSFNGGTLQAGGITSSKAITLNAGGGTFSGSTGTTSSLTGAISGVGAFTKSGNGILTLSGNNTYSGSTTVSAGTLRAGSASAFSQNSAFVVTNVLDLNGQSSTVGSLAGLNGTVKNNGGTSAILTAGGNGSDTAFTGTLTDGNSTLGLTKTGVGTMILAGANTYTGGTTISGGTLQIGAGIGGSIVGNVIDNGNLAFHRSDAVTFSGNVSGTGTLNQNGPETLTLKGANSYSGGTFVSGDGTLSVDSDTELGAVGDGIGGITLQGGELLTTVNGFSTARTIDVTSGQGDEILAAANSTTATYTGVISDAGLLEIGEVGDAPNAGTVVLTGNNTYSGGTTINSGTLQIGNGGTTGIVVGDISNGGTLVFDRSDALTFGGAISGAGNLVQMGSGTLILTGGNSYSGGTLVSGGGTISVDSDTELGAIGAGIGGITLQGGELLTTTDGFNTARDLGLSAGGSDILAAANGTTATYTGVISGGGGLVVGDGSEGTIAGTIVLTGTNTYSGGTTITSGTLSVDSDAELGATGAGTGITLQGGELLTTTNGFSTARAVDLSAGGSNILAAANGTTAKYRGVVSGAGGLVVGDGTTAGTVVLTGTNTYAGGTTIKSGLLQLGDGLTNGSITGNVTDNGTLALDPNVSATFGGVISGSGNLEKLGSGTSILTGENSYTGGTTISAGTLQIGSGGTTGSIVGDATDGGTLAFDRSDAVTFGGVISGAADYAAGKWYLWF